MAPAPGRIPTTKLHLTAAGTSATFDGHHFSPPHLMTSRPTPEVVRTARRPRRTWGSRAANMQNPATASGTRPTSAKYIHGEGHSREASGSSLCAAKIHLNPRRGITWVGLFCRKKTRRSIREGLPRPLHGTRAPPRNPLHLHIAFLFSLLSGLLLEIAPRSFSFQHASQANPHILESRRTLLLIAHLACPGPPQSS